MKKRMILLSTVMAMTGLGKGLKASDTKDVEDAMVGMTLAPKKLTDLPDEVFKSIVLNDLDLKGLYKVRKISKQMAGLVADHMETRKTDLVVRIKTLSQFESLATSIFARGTTHLNLNSMTGWTNDLIPRIAALFPKLKSLNLYRNNIGAAGAASLSEALPSLTSLTTLHLYRNDIDAAGAASLRAAIGTRNIKLEL